MSFDQTNMALLGASLTPTYVPTSWSYISGTDALATIRASGYFNDWTDKLTQYDSIYIVGTDGVDLVNVTSATGAATVTVGAFITAGDIADGSITAAKLATDAVETLKIKDANVTLAKLAVGITPSHIVKYAAQVTTAGGAAAEAITVTGVLATDLVFAEIKTVGAAPQTIITTVPTTDTITITFSGDPSNDHIIYYQVLRAAA